MSQGQVTRRQKVCKLAPFIFFDRVYEVNVIFIGKEMLIVHVNCVRIAVPDYTNVDNGLP